MHSDIAAPITSLSSPPTHPSVIHGLQTLRHYILLTRSLKWISHRTDLHSRKSSPWQPDSSVSLSQVDMIVNAECRNTFSLVTAPRARLCLTYLLHRTQDMRHNSRRWTIIHTYCSMAGPFRSLLAIHISSGDSDWLPGARTFLST